MITPLPGSSWTAKCKVFIPILGFFFEGSERDKLDRLKDTILEGIRTANNAGLALANWTITLDQKARYVEIIKLQITLKAIQITSHLITIVAIIIIIATLLRYKPIGVKVLLSIPIPCFLLPPLIYQSYYVDRLRSGLAEWEAPGALAYPPPELQ